MSALHGKSGTCAFTSAVLNVTSWTVNTSVDMAEAHSTSDVTAGYKLYLAGWKDWTATCEVNYDSTGLAISTLGSTATLTLDTVDGPAFSGTAFCTGHSVTNDMGDVSKATFNFQGSGACSEA